MDMVVSSTKIKFNRTSAGVLRIGNTRVSLDSVIHAFKQGSSPEEIALDFDALSLSEVYLAISYYLQNMNEVEAYLAGRAAQEEHLRSEVETRFDPKAIRDRLLARQNGVS